MPRMEIFLEKKEGEGGARTDEEGKGEWFEVGDRMG